LISFFTHCSRSEYEQQDCRDAFSSHINSRFSDVPTVSTAQ
jgi:hypothetical protein